MELKKKKFAFHCYSYYCHAVTFEKKLKDTIIYDTFKLAFDTINRGLFTIPEVEKLSNGIFILVNANVYKLSACVGEEITYPIVNTEVRYTNFQRLQNSIESRGYKLEKEDCDFLRNFLVEENRFINFVKLKLL